MTSERRGELLSLCADKENRYRWTNGPPVGWDELEEALKAHEGLEKAKALLFRVDGMGISAGIGDWLAERGYVDACELERDVAVFIGRPVPKRVQAALDAHEARTAAGTAAKEGE